MNSRAAVIIALALSAWSGAIIGAIFAAAVTLAICARAESPGYGFTNPPYANDREYRDCTWPDDGSGGRGIALTESAVGAARRRQNEEAPDPAIWNQTRGRPQSR